MFEASNQANAEAVTRVPEISGNLDEARPGLAEEDVWRKMTVPGLTVLVPGPSLLVDRRKQFIVNAGSQGGYRTPTRSGRDHCAGRSGDDGTIFTWHNMNEHRSFEHAHAPSQEWILQNFA